MNHSINIAAKRSGLSTHVIRVWEKRYGAVAPVRTGTNRRQYTDEEIERLVLLKQATDLGYKISQIAHVSNENLSDLIAKDRETHPQQDELPATLIAAPPEASQELIRGSMKAIQALDTTRLEESLTQSALSLGHQGMISRVIAPLAMEIGNQWRSGDLSAAHEHFASAIIRVFLANISKPFAIPETAPRLIVATPAGQLHELGAVIAASSASSAGWNVTFLGANLPAAEIAGATIQNQARALALSLVFPEDDPTLPDELKRLRSFLPKEIDIIVGGRSAAAYQKTLEEIEATICHDIAHFSRALDTLRNAPHS